MAIFACVNTKGGVGKTTVAVHLAVMLANKGKTLLIDGDPQASAASWAAWRRDNKKVSLSPTTICLSGKAILTEGKQLIEGNAISALEHVVVDAGGRDSVALRSALILAEKAIIPIGASNLDAAAMSDLLTILELSRDFNPNLKVYVLLNRVDPRTKDTASMLEFLKEQKLHVLQSKIYERVSFKRTIGEGSTVHEGKKDLMAIKEMNEFFNEVIND